MAAFPEGRPPVFSLLCFLAVMLLFSACSVEKTLVLNDPGFDYFAGRSMKFYDFRRQAIFRIKGFDPDFIGYSSADEYENEIGGLLESGVYASLVAANAPIHRIDIPGNINAVLVGGDPELEYQISKRVVSTALPALAEAGVYMRKRFDDEDLKPLVILYKSGEDLKSSLCGGWGQAELEVLEDNILEISPGDGDVRKTLEDFLENYDFGNSKFLILAHCAPVMRDVLELLPQSEQIRLILEMPDDPLYPKELEALILPDYKGLLKAAAESLKDEDAGNIRKVPYLFKEK